MIVNVCRYADNLKTELAVFLFTSIKNMKNIFLILLFICSITFGNAQKVYDTHKESRADVKVFVVDKEYRADLIVYTTNVDHRAKGNKGIWFIQHNESRADKKICFVNNESRADIKVYFTNTESRAGWKNPGKKNLME